VCFVYVGISGGRRAGAVMKQSCLAMRHTDQDCPAKPAPDAYGRAAPAAWAGFWATIVRSIGGGSLLIDGPGRPGGRVDHTPAAAVNGIIGRRVRRLSSAVARRAQGSSQRAVAWGVVDEAMAVEPARGRVVRRGRRVRLGDVSPHGRLRFDAFARYLQDVSDDDVRTSGLGEMSWVVRRTVVEVHRFAAYGEELELATFCSGVGSRWAERTVVARGDQGARMVAATLWVHLDPATMAPRTLPAGFHDVYDEAAGGRTVRARLTHAAPPVGAVGDRWPMRFVDFDVLGHVNNAAYWIPVEEHLARRRDLRAPLRAEVEFRSAVEPAHEVVLLVADDGPSLALWLVGEAGVHASATVRPLGTDAP